MLFPKPKRKKDKKVLKEFSHKPCAVCGRQPPNEAHHIKTRGAHGDDDRSNLLSLCRKHHVEVHAIGVDSFFLKYPHLVR